MLEGVVCLCSRGLVHSRTWEAVERNLEMRDERWSVVFTHDQPIPDAQNEVTDKALALGPDWLWFVEEDMLPPDGTLEALLGVSRETGCPVVAADYRLRDGRNASHRTKSGAPLFGGMGCLLVRASVFERLERPYFQTGAYSIQPDGVGGRLGFDRKYGGNDVHLFMELRRKGIRFALPDIRVAHLIVEKYGEPGKNAGCHAVAGL